MKKYSVIVFDLGIVLIPFDYQKINRRLDKIEQGLGEKFLVFYKAHYHLHREYERGDISGEQFLNAVLNALEYKISGEDFCKLFSEIFTVDEDVATLLPVLKKNYRLLLLSNTSAIHQKYGWERFPFLRHFEKLFLSYEVRAVKPEPEIYQAVTAYTQLPPSEHIFIDDVAEYAAGAKAQGWDAIQFLGYRSLIDELQLRGILVS